MPDGYRTLDQIDFNDIWYGSAGIQAAVDLYRSVDLSIILGLAMPWPEALLKYGISEKNGFQRLGPGQRPDRKIVDIATLYPVVDKHGYGVGTDIDTLQRSSGREIVLDIGRPIREDPEFVLGRFLKVMMLNPGSNNAGFGFYNGQFSAEEKLAAPPKFEQNSFASGHTHYLTSASSGDLTLPDITNSKATIRHHGNKGPLAGFINSAGVQVLEDLALFTSSSIIRSPISDDVAVNGFGDRFMLLGVAWHVSEMIPDGYFLIVEVNGAEIERPLVMFEPANMRGLRLHPGPQNDYPLIESYFDRWMGVKVWQRGAGVCVQYSAPASSAVFDNPTFI